MDLLFYISATVSGRYERTERVEKTERAELYANEGWNRSRDRKVKSGRQKQISL